jgi:hypothetical protein
MLSRRRLFLVVALLCLLVGAFAGLHAGGHDHPVSDCGLAGLGCAVAVAVALALLPRIGRLDLSPRVTTRSFASGDGPSRNSVAPPVAPGLAVLCRLRV